MLFAGSNIVDFFWDFYLYSTNRGSDNKMFYYAILRNWYCLVTYS